MNGLLFLKNIVYSGYSNAQKYLHSVILIGLVCSNSFALECSVNLIDEGPYVLDAPGAMVLREDAKYVFVLDTAVGNLNVIDTTEKRIVGKINISSDNLIGMVQNVSQQRLYISEFFSGQVHMVNIQGDFEQFSLTDSKTVADNGLGPMAYHEDRQRVFVSDAQDNILVLDEELNAISTIPASTSGRLIYDLFINNDQLFVSFESGAVVDAYDISTTPPTLLKQIVVDGNSSGLTASPDGLKLYVAHHHSNTVSIINTNTLVVTKTIPENNSLLSTPMDLAYLNGYVWTANQSNDKLIPIDTTVEDVLGTQCNGGTRPKYLLPINDSKLYVSHSLGVNEIILTEQVPFTTWRKGDSSPFVSLLATPQEGIDIIIESGVGDFTITTTAGMTAQSTSDDTRQWHIQAPPIFGQHPFYLRDNQTKETQTRFIKVGLTPVVSPTGPLSIVLGRQELFNVDAGFPPYIWLTEQGLLSSNTGKQVLYVPRITGHDTLTLMDAMGSQVTVDIDVQGELSMAPLTAVMLLGEERDFQALGGSEYQWNAPIDGTVSSLTGERIKYKTPNKTGEYSLILTETSRDQSVQAIIHVISEELKLTPAQVNVGRTGTQLFSIVGGYGPYVWTTEYGALSNTQTDLEGSQVIYTAPELSVQDTLTVRDTGGRKTTASIQITASLRLTPALEFIALGDSVDFQLKNAVGDVTWQTTTGAFQEESNQSVTYTAPNKVGRYAVIAADDAGNIAQSQVIVTSDEISVNPANTLLSENQVELFIANGGIEPYSWSTTLGSLSSFEGRTAFFTPPSCFPLNTEDLTAIITLEDGMGRINKATAQINCSSDIESQYDANNDQKVDRAELFLALEDYEASGLSDEQLQKEITLYFLTSK